MPASKTTKSKKLITAQRHWFNGLVCNHQKFWKRLGDFENKVLEFDLSPIEIDRPVYVCGLARSGSTILLEFLASHSDFVSHKYSDFPFVFTPYLWRSIQKMMFLKPSKAEERFHGDGLMINSDSPEAMEEILWMHFYEGLHEPDQPKMIADITAKDGFDAYYKHHLCKLLYQSKAKRYLAKGNYNLGRIDRILDIIPDAQFLIPVRHPYAHVESLMRQHHNFLDKTQNDKRALKHLERVGHFEFGADLRPLYLGNDEVYNSILQLFEAGDTLRAYARYWAYIYGYVHEKYVTHNQVLCYRYEDFCENTQDSLGAISHFVGVNYDSDVLQQWENFIQAPDYYQSSFSEKDQNVILQEVKNVIGKWGYV